MSAHHCDVGGVHHYDYFGLYQCVGLSVGHSAEGL
jgi:hypothetical protein